MWQKFLARFFIHSVETLFYPLVTITVFFVIAEDIKPGFASYFFDLRYLVSCTLIVACAWIMVGKTVQRYFSISK